jgi:hypothetical protein
MLVDYFLDKAENNFDGYRIENMIIFSIGLVVVGFLGLATLIVLAVVGLIGGIAGLFSKKK